MADAASRIEQGGYTWTTPTDLARAVRQGLHIHVFYIHLPFAAEIEATFGSHAHRDLFALATKSLGGALEELGFPFGVDRWPVDDIVLWIGYPAENARTFDEPSMSGWLQGKLREAFDRHGPNGYEPVRAEAMSIVGRSMSGGASGDPLRAYAKALRDAQLGACDPAAREHQRHTALMDRALRERAFTFHYQPIVDMGRRQIFAHEALCRGTLDALRFPDVIFTTAERTRRIWELGRVLRDLIAAGLDQPCTQGASDDDEEQLMFINVHPLDIDDPQFLEQSLNGALRRHAGRVVFELTERAAIRDYRRVKDFFATLRQQGYRLAIDDLGSGYAGLTSLAELEPEFIKFDMALIRDLHLHPIKQRLIERMHDFAREIGALTISEGVEIAEERDALLDAGCNFMQGFYFARPAAGFDAVPLERYGRLSRPAGSRPRLTVSG